MRGRTTIGVTGPDRGGLIAWWMTAWAVRRCGGVPVRITPNRPREGIALHGLIIGGGTDVDPLHYGEDSVADDDDQPGTVLDWIIGLTLGLARMLFATGSNQDYDPDRDTLETGLIRRALYEDIPILGICRGAQLMNVVLGGTLHQSIEHFYTEDTRNVRSILPRKRITLAAHSHLQQILQTPTCIVNALHDQSIRTPGEQVTISATEHTGVIQAIERREHRYFIGVQWHPEYMPQSAAQLRLFRQLVHSAAGEADRAV